MKQFYLGYINKTDFLEKLNRLKAWCEECGKEKVLFQIYSEIMDKFVILEISSVLDENWKNAVYVGCLVNGNILNGQFASSQVMVVATVFEKSTSCAEVLQYEFTAETDVQAAELLRRELERKPWVKAIEMYVTIPEMSTTAFCNALRDIRPDIQVFGGIACGSDINSTDVFVFAKGGRCSDKAIAFVLYGGDEFYVTSMRVTGWKPLGKKFRITRAQDDVLYELDGKPAYNIYRDYLNINNDDNFFYHTLEFPLFYEHNEVTLLRTPIASNQDGSVTMSCDIETDSVVRIAYGNPSTILETVTRETGKLREFMPDVLHIFSCAARRTFWNSDEEAVKELRAFKSIAPMAGFFTHGEFLREKSHVNQHNVTLVIAAMREGEPSIVPAFPETEEEAVFDKMPIVTRLSTFVGAVVAELESANEKQIEANKQLEILNEKLAHMAIHDGLTNLYNRTEMQRYIVQQAERIKKEKFSLIMLDVDNFKCVNDLYGHQTGDEVIIALADILRYDVSKRAQNALCGRWGGEEFMVLLPGMQKEDAVLVAEAVRKSFESHPFSEIPNQTVSLGVVEADQKESMDMLFTRVDAALYDAKEAGKNRVCTR